VDGHPRYQWLDDLIAQEPRIIVPTVALEGGDQGVSGPSAAEDREYFTGRYEHRLLRGGTQWTPWPACWSEPTLGRSTSSDTD
jgi:hypothetical protein